MTRMTNHTIVASCIVAASILVATSLFSQRATELYMPIGKSPGLSEEEVTVIGTVESVDEEERSFTIAGADGPASAVVTERTHIYLDRSELQRSNLYGDFDDLKVGRRVEVLYEDRDSIGEGPAEWIKIEVTDDEG